MLSREQYVAWSADESSLVRNVAELDLLLNKLDAEHGRDDPIILIVGGPGQEDVYFGVGGDMSFVSSTEEPYLTTVGDNSADGEVDYFFQGHHSPVARKQLIPADIARKIIREFFVSGVLPSWQTWKPIGPDKAGLNRALPLLPHSFSAS